MSFPIKFGYNKSPKETINKNVHYSSGGQRTGTLKDASSIVDPVILIEAGASAFTGINYFEIPIFGRKYFITDIRTVRQGLVEIYGHCDVLSSVAEQLNQQECIVESLQRGFNRYLNDGSFKVYQNRAVINNFQFPNSFDTFDYVLALAGS